MISVAEARTIILDKVKPLGTEFVAVGAVAGRIAASEIIAKITQPPFVASAMDGYAVKFAEAQSGAHLRVVGEAPAGAPFNGKISAGEAIRIFTGAPVPDGADHVVIQEDISRNGDTITINDKQDRPRNIRNAGIDFAEGDSLAAAGEPLHEIHGSIFAAANLSEISVARRPRIAIFSNGDELIEPGSDLKPGQIINSNHYGLTALMTAWGGDVEYLGCAPDNETKVREYFERARDFDLFVPLGGASVGDYDFVRKAFTSAGGALTFEKIAVRPGKPTWFGRINDAFVLGLPGNPASALVTAALFVQPLVRKLAGEKVSALEFEKAALTAPLSANGPREAFLRAVVIHSAAGKEISPSPNQDSSLLTPFLKSNALLRRISDAPAEKAGETVEYVRLR
ncbi:MAG: molybdopterin molybdotransferase MoeA [Marinicaulis sp.]|nr:molybdopterin molybdotransferase MoeA [Marinicaulis sp.]